MILSKSLKKLLISEIALITLATTGAGFASIQNTANASSRTAKINKLEHLRNQDYNHIKSIDRELNELMPHKASKHHENVATWYLHNYHKLYRRNINRSKMFRMGYNDAIDNDNGFTPMSYHDLSGALSLSTVLNKKFAQNKKYRLGWIIGCATGSDEANYGDSNTTGSYSDFKNTLKYYRQGVHFAKANHSDLVSLVDWTWSIAKNEY